MGTESGGREEGKVMTLGSSNVHASTNTAHVPLQALVHVSKRPSIANMGALERWHMIVQNPYSYYLVTAS